MDSVIHNTYIEKIIEDIAKIDAETLIFIVDHNVWAHYSKSFDVYSNFKDKKIILWKAIDGEKVKNFKEYESCIEFLLEKGIQRNSHIIAFGGGALSDFAGFVAATILRGISWSVVPTTLLSMVDASIGGKVAINSQHGKNLIGAFNYPQNIWINSDFLDSLSKEDKISGKGEILKYCFLSQEIYEAVMNNSNINDTIMFCANYKNNITKSDFKEKGKRKVLNFGHTIGHALERHYSLPHGHAVILGIGLMLFIDNNEALIYEFRKLVNSLNIDVPEVPWLNRTFPTAELMNYIRKDKKSISTNDIEMIIVDKIGEPQIVKKTFNGLEELLGSKKNELRTFAL